MNVISASAERSQSSSTPRCGLIETVEEAQATAERVRALMQAVHLAIYDATDLAGRGDIASRAASKLQTIDVLADIIDSHGAQLSHALERISREAMRRPQAEAMASG